MVVIKCQIRLKGIHQRIMGYIRWKISQAMLTAQALTYNEHMSMNYTVDVLLEPIFWFVDNFAQCLGKAFVCSVTVLTTAVVVIAYWIGVPYWWEKSPSMTIFLVIFGNWLLMNILFHYYMGVVTPPGYPPHGTMIVDAASICKKCISPKPPRTHHCSVCDRCILAMDHHCPWLNNCVGYFNARYFYLYMVYMVAGVIFLIIAGSELGYQVLLGDNPVATLPNDKPDPDLIGHPVRINRTGALVPVKDIEEYDSNNFPREHVLPVPEITELHRICAHPWKPKAVVFMAVTSIATLFALGILVIMHGKHISRGESSVEGHINNKLKQKGHFRNPYDFGRRKNWYLFLGITQGRTFIRHVLFPSKHTPIGNGMSWYTIHNTLEDWP